MLYLHLLSNVVRDRNFLDALNSLRNVHGNFLVSFNSNGNLLRNRDLHLNLLRDRDLNLNLIRHRNIDIHFNRVRYVNRDLTGNVNPHFIRNRNLNLNGNIVRTRNGDSDFIRSGDGNLDVLGRGLYLNDDFICNRVSNLHLKRLIDDHFNRN